MTRILLIALLCSTGCLIVAKDTSTTRTVSTHSSAPWTPGKPGAAMIQARPAGSALQVWTIAPRVCTRNATEVREIRHGKAADVDVFGANIPGNVPQQAAIVVVAAAAVLVPIAAVSGVVTAIELAVDKPTIERVTVAGEERTSCPVVVRDFPVDIRWTSGTRTHATTGADGRVDIAIPDTEPQIGSAIVSGDGVARTIAYDRRNAAKLDAQRQQLARDAAELSTIAAMDHASCTNARSAAMLEAQQIRDLQARTKALLALPDCTYRGP
ncbi:MAG TPA: hypothetical protein VLB44_05625 [Kofleriaceae bacterium]|nr:hypothetical protein [Kofleriaceae bacterium]